MNKIVIKILKRVLDLKIARIISDKVYLQIMYRLSYGKKLNLKNPINYNEKLQWLKLYDRNPLYTILVDKYEVKKYVADKIGNEYIIPTIGIYDKFQDIDFNKLPDKFVIKCTHDSGGLVVCRDKNKLEKKYVQSIVEKSLSSNYFYCGREWPYKNVKPRIIIEEYLCTNNDLNFDKKNLNSLEMVQKKNGLLDYKFMCFDGKVKALFLDIGVIGKGTGHAEKYFRNVYDEKFNLLPILETRENYPSTIEKPRNFEKMVEIAEKLSKGIPHVRVDLYNLNGHIYFGEMTFFHGSGLSNVFKPEEWNIKFGSYIDLEKVKKFN